MVRPRQVVLLLALALPTSVTSQAPFTLADLSSLTGCWADLGGEMEVREHWTEPTGGMMLGTTRFLSGGRVVDWEFGRLVEEDGGVTLWPYPKGTISARGFPLVRAGRTLVFENPEHDFPVRIVYARDGDDKMEVRAEGSAGQVIGWSFVRIACPGA